MSSEKGLHPCDDVLLGFIGQLMHRYHTVPPQLHGGRFYVTVIGAAWGADLERTVLFESQSPRLLEGILPAPPESLFVPFLHLRLNGPQFIGFFNGSLSPDSPEAEGLKFNGNSEELYIAINNALN